MELLLKNAFKTQIENKRGFDFEDFIDELYKNSNGLTANFTILIKQ